MMDASLENALDQARAEFPKLPATDPRRRSIPHLLFELLARAPGTLTRDDVEGLTQLCFKVDVTGGVRAYYKHNWKPPRGAPPLASDCWRPLVLVLLLASHAEVPAASECDALGFRLKCLNAALTAMDLITASDASAVTDDLRAWARTQLESELSCPTT